MLEKQIAEIMKLPGVREVCLELSEWNRQTHETEWTAYVFRFNGAECESFSDSTFEGLLNQLAIEFPVFDPIALGC
jgi:hypothetical protein